MSKWAYYNEHDPNAAEWIRQLIKLGQIAPGTVDERSIKDVHSDDLRSFSQIHLFCGIAVWPYALRQAGWDDDRPILSGSAPCQSFSAAGLQRGFDDPRHFWPHMFRIIRELRPCTVVGEQVSSKLAMQWWDLVAGDLESEGYAATAIDLEAAGCGAPHHRARLFWVGHSEHSRHDDIIESRGAIEKRRVQQPQRPSNTIKSLADTTFAQRGDLQSRSHIFNGTDNRREKTSFQSDVSGEIKSMVDTHSHESAIGIASSSNQGNQQTGWNGSVVSNGSSPTFWDDAIWLPCRDGKHRPTHPDIYPLASAKSSPSAMAPRSTAGVGCSGDISLSIDPTIEEVQNSQEGRGMRLRGFGNSLCAPLAIEFVKAVMEVI